MVGAMAAFMFSLFFATAGWAAEGVIKRADPALPRNHRESYQCSYYNQYGRDAAYYCQQDFNCQWDQWYGCVEASAQSCEQIGDWQQCQQSGCYWDRSYGCQDWQTPDRGIWQCTAVDDGWEEHRGGHTGQGYSQQLAAQAALQACLSVHGSCSVTSCDQIR